MKKIAGLIMILSMFLVSASFAEYLTSADCMPQGKWALGGAYLGAQYGGGYISSAAGLTGSHAIGLRGAGLSVTYGLTNKIEVTVGYGTAGGMGPGLDVLAAVGGGKIDLQATNLLGAIKLGIKQEMLGDPFSLALGIMTKQGNIKINFPATLPAALGVTNVEKTLSQYTVGLLVSQLAIPFIPYAGAGYEVNIYSKPDAVYGSFESSFGFVVGTALFLRENIATFWEINSRNYSSPTTGNSYNITEYAGRVAWIIN